MIFGVTLRITITSEGFAGTSFDVIVRTDYVDIAILHSGKEKSQSICTMAVSC